MQILLYMYKFKFNLLPASCSRHVTHAINDQHYNFRRVNEFQLVKFRSEIRKRFIAVVGPDLWNALRDLSEIPVRYLFSS